MITLRLCVGRSCQTLADLLVVCDDQERLKDKHLLLSNDMHLTINQRIRTRKMPNGDTEADLAPH